MPVGLRLLRAAVVRLAWLGGAGMALAWAAAVAAGTSLGAPDPTAFITDRTGAFLTQAGHEGRRADGGRQVDYGYWPVDPPPRVVAATLALEDRRFAVPPRGGPGGRAAGGVAAPAWRRLRGVHDRDAGGPDAAPPPAHALGQGGGGGHGGRHHTALWPRCRAGAISPAGPLWGEQSWHRPRRPVVFQPARRRPERGAGGAAVGDPASPDRDGAPHRAAARDQACPACPGHHGPIAGRAGGSRRGTGPPASVARAAAPAFPPARVATRTAGVPGRRGPRDDRRPGAAPGHPWTPPRTWRHGAGQGRSRWR